MIFKYILNHAEPFALDLDPEPLCVSVRAQVILGFVALGLGKGGLFVSTFLGAMAWSEDGWLAYAVIGSIVTLAVMTFGYIITFGRIEATIDLQTQEVHLIKRIPFHRTAETIPLDAYEGVALQSDADDDNRTTHLIYLAHTNADLNVPLWGRTWPDAPTAERDAYATRLNLPPLP